jgi:hypothetical protein
MWRIGVLVLVWATLVGCEVELCPPDGEPHEGVFARCSAEHEPCGGIDADTRCTIGLECVSTVECAVGPCPGTCLAPCRTDDDCGPHEVCAVLAGWSEDRRYCAG